MPPVWAARAVLTLLLTCLAPLALAAEGDLAGRAVIVLGEVEAVAADGSVRTLARGDEVRPGDTLRTGPRGRAQIRFTDGARMALRPDTELAVDEYEHAPAEPPARQRTTLRLSRGGFRAITGAVADRNRAAYRVVTPQAILGVRGTDFSAVIADLGDGLQLYVGVRSGGIFATNDAGTIDLGLGAPFSFAVIRDFDSLPEGLRSPPTILLVLFGLGLGDEEGPDAGGGGTGGGGEGGDEDVVYRLTRRCL
ncbi:MAG TPA: FecR family protein [Pseudomonadales bacterium]|nr:FecR family protein [Pseudomonadales bacterium]